MRRTLIIVAIAVVTLGIAAVAYFYFARTPSLSVGTQPGSNLPQAGSTGQTGTDAGNAAEETAVPVTARLLKITSGPVAAGTAVISLPPKDASSSPETVVEFLERQSGNAYRYSTGARSLTRTSNRTLPGIERAVWLPDGSAAIVQYLSGDDLSTVNTYALKADGSQGFFLPQDLADVAVSSTSILALASGSNGSTATLTRTDGSGASNAFSTPLSSLRVAFAGKNQYVAFTKPSASIAGYAYAVDASGRFSRLAGPATGLVALPSPSGAWVLVSMSGNGSMTTELVNTKDGTILPLPLATLADKCAWASDDSAVYCGVPENPPQGNYPDDWYQGATHFSDRIWKIDVAGRYASLVLDFSTDAKEPLDAEAIAVDPEKTTLVFVNRNDGSLWAYRL